MAGVCRRWASTSRIHAKTITRALDALITPDFRRAQHDDSVHQWNVDPLVEGVHADLGCDKRLCARAVSGFVAEFSRSLRRRAKKLLGLGSVSQAHTGAVAAIQRTDSALRLNVHVHVLALDGVYVRERANADLTFHASPARRAAAAGVGYSGVCLEHCERCGGALRWVEAATTVEAIARLLAKHGLAARPPPAPIAPFVPLGQLRFAFMR